MKAVPHLRGFVLSQESKMIVKELLSAFVKSQDLLFLYWAYAQILEKLNSRTDARSQAVKMANLIYATEIQLNFDKLLKEELPFLNARTRLEAFLKTGNPFLSSFVPKPNNPEALLLGVRTFPAFMAEWNAASRRVFQLGAETQGLLEATDYGELELDDLVIPFPSFVIRLATPVTYHGKEFTAIGFSQDTVAKEVSGLNYLAWSYVLLADDAGYEPLSPRRKEKLIENMSKTKKTGEVFATLAGMLAIISKNTVPAIAIPLGEKMIPSVDQLTMGEEGATNCVKKIHSIVVNLMAVMARLSKAGPAGKSVNGEPPQGVSSTENVFDISGLSTLGDIVEAGTPAGYPACNQNRRRITPHWRRKHLRRRPGMGHIPDAPRDVKVPATLVLGDFLEIGTLPVGGITKI